MSAIHRPGPSSVNPQRSWRPKQHGMALITSVMLLVVVSLLALSMFKSFGLQEKLAGNTLEKQRSFQAAQSALQYGEWALEKGLASGTGVPCTASVNGNTIENLKVCNSELANPTTVSSWDAAGMTYTPAGMDASGGGGLTTSTTATANDITYTMAPSVYINYLGAKSDGTVLYQVTAIGFGGSGANSASVVQSVYTAHSPLTKDLTQE